MRKLILTVAILSSTLSTAASAQDLTFNDTPKFSQDEVKACRKFLRTHPTDKECKYVVKIGAALTPDQEAKLLAEIKTIKAKLQK